VGGRRGAGHPSHPALAVIVTRRLERTASFRPRMRCVAAMTRPSDRSDRGAPQGGPLRRARSVRRLYTAPRVFHKPDALGRAGSSCRTGAAAERPGRRRSTAERRDRVRLLVTGRGRATRPRARSAWIPASAARPRELDLRDAACSHASTADCAPWCRPDVRPRGTVLVENRRWRTGQRQSVAPPWIRAHRDVVKRRRQTR
jgi:hypothetical protein